MGAPLLSLGLGHLNGHLHFITWSLLSAGIALDTAARRALSEYAAPYRAQDHKQRPPQHSGQRKAWMLGQAISCLRHRTFAAQMMSAIRKLIAATESLMPDSA